MSNFLKVLFASVIILLSGVIVYLGWTYYAETKKISILKSPSSNQVPLPAGVEKSQGEKYQGLIFCLRDVEKGTPLALCEAFGIVINGDKFYELVESGVDASIFSEKDEVTVLGVIKPGLSPLGPPDGTIYVFEISRF